MLRALLTLPGLGDQGRREHDHPVELSAGGRGARGVSGVCRGEFARLDDVEIGQINVLLQLRYNSYRLSRSVEPRELSKQQPPGEGWQM